MRKTSFPELASESDFGETGAMILDLALTLLLRWVVTIPLVVIALFPVRDRRPRYAVLFLALMALDAVLLWLPGLLNLHPAGVQWNWIGKFLSVVWVLVFLRSGPLSARDVGLTLRQRPGSVVPALGWTALFVGVSVAIQFLVFFGPDDVVTVEALLYQATMPGIAEELVYRGVFLTLLMLALGGDLTKESSSWRAREVLLPVLITSFHFGIVHALSYDGAVQFDVMSFLFPFIGGLVWAALRLETGSLLFPILAHNGGNFIAVLLAYLL